MSNPSLKALESCQNPRLAAFIIVFHSYYHQCFCQDLLHTWKKHNNPKTKDLNFCQRISMGVLQRWSTLEKVALAHSSKRKLSLKGKEKVLLFLGLYQKLFLDRVPLYSILDEGGKLNYQYASQFFSNFYTACIQKADEKDLQQPKTFFGSSDLAEYYSFTPFFIQVLQRHFQTNEIKSILTALNQHPKVHIRSRKAGFQPPKTPLIYEKPFAVFEKKSDESLEQFLTKDFYIQNLSPIQLVCELCDLLEQDPKNVLDLCASPGGKAFLIHDLFPKASLTLNDVSESKIETLKENLARLETQAECHIGKGEDFPESNKYDLIVLDVPCSNSGVLNKRPEARWRLKAQADLDPLLETQKNLLTKASHLVSDEGAILYCTCSILPEENRKQVQAFLKEHPEYLLVKDRLILPSEKTGQDGSYGALLEKAETED